MSPTFGRRVTLGCLVVLAAVVAFTVVGVAGTPELTATEFDPETDHGELASAPSIHDADNGSSPRDEIRDAFTVAAEDGRYEGTVPNASEKDSFIREERYDFVLFDGTFYEFEASVDGDSVVIEADERAPKSIADELAVSLENASDPAREVIETGEPVEAPGGGTDTPIAVDDDTYYRVRPGHGSNGAVGAWLVILPGTIVLLAGVAAVGAALRLRRRRAE